MILTVILVIRQSYEIQFLKFMLIIKLVCLHLQLDILVFILQQMMHHRVSNQSDFEYIGGVNIRIDGRLVN